MVGRSRRSNNHNVPAPGSNTDILGTNITPKYDGEFKVTVSLATDSVFNLVDTDGTDSFTQGLKESGTLNASDRYTFTFAVQTGHSYNFQVETDGIIETLIVDELNDVGSGGVAHA